MVYDGVVHFEGDPFFYKIEENGLQICVFDGNENGLFYIEKPDGVDTVFYVGELARIYKQGFSHGLMDGKKMLVQGVLDKLGLTIDADGKVSEINVGDIIHRRFSI
jgi:hypothetical protein